MTIAEIVDSHSKNVIRVDFWNDGKVQVLKSHTYTLRGAINEYCEIFGLTIKQYYRFLEVQRKYGNNEQLYKIQNRTANN